MELKVLIYDIETLKKMFLLCIYIPETGEIIDVEISGRKNETDKLIKLVETYEEYYWVGFNNLRFDSQIIEYIVRSHENWIELTGEEICSKIYQKSQDVIDDGNYDIFPQYREEFLFAKQIDLFTIWHFNNLNRRTSLKAIEFAIDFENIEEMPLHHSKEELTEDEMSGIISYCHNDIFATYELYKITRGNTSLALYKGKDKIADRFIIQEEVGMNCLNWDDVKIGAEWNKADYIKLTGRSERDLKPQKVNHYYGKKFKQFFPNTVEFISPELKEFIRKFGETFALNKKQEFKYKFNDELTATIAKGGIHSSEGGRIIIPEKGYTYWQIDIGSQYPNAIRKYKVEPKHLKGWNSLIVSKIDRRLKYKALFKETKNPKYASLQEMGKLSLNGGAYGRLNTKGDWQEDPSCMLQVTIGGQLEILMVVETLILKGFRVVSLNTDGFDAIISNDREAEFREIISEFEKKIGNDVLGNFEYTEFKWIAQISVNDYIAFKADGTVKVKGDFEINKELHKNKSMRIVPIALHEYFVNKIPVKQTIRMGHKYKIAEEGKITEDETSIYDFCIRQKASKDFHYEGISKNGKNVYNKLIRYYVANEGEKLLKIKNPTCETNAAPVSQVEAGEWKCFVCNKLSKDHPSTNINFSYYIEKAEKIIAKVEGKKTVKVTSNQLSLF